MPLSSLRPRVGTLDMRTAQPPAKVVDPFYLSPEWRQLVASIIAKRGRRCQQCGRKGCRIFGDHIKELRDGGAPLDEGNVLLRCGSCHTRKTAKVRAERMSVDHSRQANQQDKPDIDEGDAVPPVDPIHIMQDL